MSATSNPNSTTHATPNARCSYQTVAEAPRDLAELASAVSSTARATTTPPSPSYAKAFATSECGIFAHGFCPRSLGDRGHDYFVAFLQRPGSLPSCTTRRMVETAAHLNDHVFPACRCASGCCRFPRGCGTSCNATGAVLMVLRIFLRVIAQTLQTHSPGAAHMDKEAAHRCHRLHSPIRLQPTNTSTSTFVGGRVFEGSGGRGRC